MITEQDLRAAIAECEGTPKPNANTCIKLAAYYTILNYMKSEPVIPTRTQEYSYDAGHLDIPYSDSEFSQLVKHKGLEQAFEIIDELMDTLMVINPSLYNSVIRKISEL